MSLNHLEAIPVDTHVFQISQRYLPHLKTCKTVTDKVYNEIVSHFQNLYGKYAGWAHSVSVIKIECKVVILSQSTIVV